MVRKLVGAGLATALMMAGGWAMAQKYEYAPPGPGSMLVQLRENTGSYGNGTETATIRHERRTWEITYTVEAYEDVTVKAGTFKAFRVRQSSNLGNEDVSWWSPEQKIHIKQRLKRSGMHPQGSGTSARELVSHDLRP